MTVEEMKKQAEIALERAKTLEAYLDAAQGFTDEQRALYDTYVSDYGQQLESALETNSDAMAILSNAVAGLEEPADTTC